MNDIRQAHYMLPNPSDCISHDYGIPRNYTTSPFCYML